MRRIVLLLAALIAPSVVPDVARAQAHPLVGEWSVTYAGGIRMEDGVQTAVMVTGTLRITSEGDSLVATLKGEPTEGMPPRPPVRFAAQRVLGPVTFVQRSEATLNINGELSTRTAVATYVLDATAASVSGTITRQIEGIDMPADARPITGTRVTR